MVTTLVIDETGQEITRGIGVDIPLDQLVEGKIIPLVSVKPKLGDGQGLQYKITKVEQIRVNLYRITVIQVG